MFNKCTVCGKENLFDICMECIKARQRAVVYRKCCCGKSKIPDENIKQVCSRKWIACKRCLGTIKQLS